MASIFSKIIAGELPGHFVWEDSVAVAILTIQPIRPGHVLVIPRDEIDHWDDLPAKTAQHLMRVSQQLAKALKKAYPARRVGMMIAGLEVPHTHIHLVPLDTMEDLSFAQASSADIADLAQAAQKIRANLNQID